MKIKNKIRLDVGCGERKQHGFTGMDKRNIDGVEIIHDAEDIPWPLEDESCCIVLLSHLIEHIKAENQIKVINEIWRIMEPDGLLIISTPYPMSFGWFQDPTHCASWNEATPYYFEPGNTLYDVYKPLPWKVDTLTFDIRSTLEVALRKDGKIQTGNNAQKSPGK